jgi:hypothetical protein
VQLRIAPQLPEIAVDRIQLQQVLVNLVRNAVEAMQSERRELTVSAAPDGDGGVAIRVADTGPGLAPEVAERLFQPFVTTKPQGMGIGLSILAANCAPNPTLKGVRSLPLRCRQCRRSTERCARPRMRPSSELGNDASVFRT